MHISLRISLSLCVCACVFAQKLSEQTARSCAERSVLSLCIIVCVCVYVLCVHAGMSDQISKAPVPPGCVV